MAEDVKFEISVEGNAEKVIKSITTAIKGLGDASETNLKKSSTAFEVFQGALGAGVALKAIGLLIDAGKKLFDVFVTEGIAAASEQEDAINRLNQALAQSGQFTEQASRDLLDFASNLQKTSKFTDEVIASQLSFAISLGASSEQAKSLVQAAADFSSQTGKDFEGTVQALTKSLNGNATELKKLFPELKNFTDEQLKAGAAVDLLSSKFAGGAANSLNTFSGSVTLAKNSFGELQESFGETITQNPVVIKVLQQLSSEFENLKKFIDNNKQSIQVFVALLVNAVTGPLATFTAFLADISFSRGKRSVGTMDEIAAAIKRIDDAAQQGLTNALVGSEFNKTSFENQKKNAQELALLKEQEAIKAEEGLVKEIEAKIAQNEQLKTIDEEAYAARIAANEDFINRSLAGLQKGTDAEIKLKSEQVKKEQQIGQQRVQAVQLALGTISTLMQNSSGELFEIGKAAAIAQATIDGVLAVQKVLATIPFPFNIPLAALMGVAVAANVSKIASTPPPAFATGSSFVEGPSGTDNVPAFLTRGERVFTTDQNQDFTRFLQTEGNNSTLLAGILARLDNLSNGVMVNIGGKTLVNTLNDELATGLVLDV